MKILILGAAGQIGSFLADGLATGNEVTGTSRENRAGLVRFDPFTDSWKSLGAFDVLINCVGQIESTPQNSFEKVHTGLTRLIIENAAVLGHPKVFQLSALGASVSNPVEFLRTKGVADQLLLQQENTVVLRPSIVCTPGTMLVRKIRLLAGLASLTFGRLLLPEGFLQTKIQPVMPRDIFDAVKKLLHAEGRITVNLVGPETLSFRDLLDMISAKKTKPLKLIEFSRTIADFLVLRIAVRVIPKLINSQQYQLLFTDNIADATPLCNLLERPLLSTREFFMHELMLER